MTKQEIIDNNRLIAVFMGVKIGEDKYSWRPGCVEPVNYFHLQYHSNWSWLMPVVHKAYEVTNDDDRSFNHLSIFEYGLGASMEDIYSGVVEFVKWYNETKRNT